MAKDKKEGSGGTVSDLPKGCLSQGCKTKATRAGFCEEHYVWFKEGLLTKEGVQPKDFDKKYQIFLHRHKKTA